MYICSAHLHPLSVKSIYSHLNYISPYCNGILAKGVALKNSLNVHVRVFVVVELTGCSVWVDNVNELIMNHSLIATHGKCKLAGFLL